MNAGERFVPLAVIFDVLPVGPRISALAASKQVKSSTCAVCRSDLGELNPNWKGGFTKHKKGSLMRRVANHPRAGDGKYVFEHGLRTRSHGRESFSIDTKPRSSNNLPRDAENSWRWRDSNPRPLNRWRQHLRAQPSASIRRVGPQRQASHSPIRNQSLPSGPGPRRTHPALRRPVPARQAPPGRTGCVS